jgi:nucleoside-diphosphate-sugar epimerase
MKKSIYITGASGFVGTNLMQHLGSAYSFNPYNRKEAVEIKDDVVIHLAGKAHDLKNTTEEVAYYQANTELTQIVYDTFLASDANVFIYLSSVKAVADKVEGDLTEETPPNPITHYGKSKLLAEKYIFSKPIPVNKRVYVLRPCLIHGPGNKGNLNLLFKLVEKGIPWPLAAFENRRSFCSIRNIIFAIQELIEREDIASGTYNIADDEALSTNDLICLIGEAIGRKSNLLKLPQPFIRKLAKLGDILHLPLNTERLEKLTESYVVSNNKLATQMGKTFPISSRDGLKNTFKSFNN